MPINDYSTVWDDYKKMYSYFPVPTFLCDKKLLVRWSNQVANDLYPDYADINGIIRLLGEFSIKDLMAKIQSSGSCTIIDAVPLSNVQITLCGIIRQDKVVGILVQLMCAEYRGAIQSTYVSSQAADTMNANLRELMDNIFGIMDSAALKADFLQSGWIKASFNQIGMNGYKILRISENIAQYARFQSGKAALDPSLINIGTMLGEMESNVQAIAAQMDIDIEFRMPSTRCMIFADINQIELCIYNILHNSFYYTRPNNVVVVKAEQSGVFVKITIQDRGIGIGEDRIDRVLDPYVSYARDEHGAGLGLGLFLAKAVTHLHRGDIAIQSKQDEGTTVTLRFPLAGFDTPAALAQRERPKKIDDRFSSVYTRLIDAKESPYRK